MMHILWQLQLSNYYDGKFSLTGDSNWTTFIAKAKQLIKLDSEIYFTVVAPFQSTIHENMYELLGDNGLLLAVDVWHIDIPVDAIASRYHFNYTHMSKTLGSTQLIDMVYINDPCLLGNYKALFFKYKKQPLFFSQCHFLDKPSAPLVPSAVSYVHRTLEACEKADLAIWHCQAQLYEFIEEFDVHNLNNYVWKSGHSSDFLDTPINYNNLRFDPHVVSRKKKVVWVPNRIGGLGRSLDYTNNGRFLFDELPSVSGDFIVLCGNPSQKISNQELTALVPRYQELVPGAMNLDEYKWCCQRADVVVSLYDKDSNGGIAVLESMYYGAVPLMPNINEYSRYFFESNFPNDYMVNSNLSNIPETLELLLSLDSDAVETLHYNVGGMLQAYSFETTTKHFYEVLRAKLSTI